MCQILADNICFGTWAMYGQGLVLAYLPLSKIWSTDKSIVLELENSNCNSKSSRTRELELQHECGTVLVGTVDFKEWLHTLLKSFAEGLPPQFGKSCSRPATLCKALHLDNLSPTRSILLLGIALWYLVLLLPLPLPRLRHQLKLASAKLHSTQNLAKPRKKSNGAFGVYRLYSWGL